MIFAVNCHLRPTFFLDGDVQGITEGDFVKASLVARDVMGITDPSIGVTVMHAEHLVSTQHHERVCPGRNWSGCKVICDQETINGHTVCSNCSSEFCFRCGSFNGDLVGEAAVCEECAVYPEDYFPECDLSCDQCNIAVIQGKLCHEHGCPNTHKIKDMEMDQWVNPPSDPFDLGDE